MESLIFRRTKVAEILPLTAENMLLALMDTRVNGPYPLIRRFRDVVKLVKELGVDRVNIDDKVQIGRMVVVRRDEF